MEKGKPVNQEFHTSISFTRSCWPSWKRVQSCAVSVCKHRLTVIDNWPVTYNNINSTGSHLSKLGEGKQCVPVVRLMVSQVSVPVECVLGANQLGSAVPALGLKSGQTCSRQASIERRMLRQNLRHACKPISNISASQNYLVMSPVFAAAAATPAPPARIVCSALFATASVVCVHFSAFMLL